MDFSVSGAIAARLKISASAIETLLTELRHPEREIEILKAGGILAYTKKRMK